MTTQAPILRATRWRHNGELIAAVARLGYLHPDDYTLDCTWGRGTWWATWRPKRLEGSDLDPDLSPTATSVDFTDLPWDDATFDAVCFDPPYKLNGTPTATVDQRYGVHTVRSRDERHQLMLDGLTECARVTRTGGVVLAKCQDQVEGGKVRWQTRMLADHAETHCDLELIDRLDMLGGRPQPAGRRQVRVHANYSTLLVLRKAR